MKKTKKAIGFLLSAVMILSMSVTIFAQTPVYETPDKEYTVEDVKALEPYISVENGHFVFDAESAVANNVDLELINGQTFYLDLLNARADEGSITINNDLSIDAPKTIAATGHWDNCGGGLNTDVTEYWWGYSRYACDCQTNRISSDFSTCSSAAAALGILGGYFGFVGTLPGGLTSAYWWLLSSRLNANNHGKGVYIELTRALVFDITPQ